MKFNFDATGIGSVPFKDPESALSVIFENLKAVPFWPQLPRRSFMESMYVQYSEGMPGLVIDDSRKTIHIESVKAAGGIRDLDALLRVRALGVTRCGATRTAAMLDDAGRRLGLALRV
mgnify:CR=1 FL=1